MTTRKKSTQVKAANTTPKATTPKKETVKPQTTAPVESEESFVLNATPVDIANTEKPNLSKVTVAEDYQNELDKKRLELEAQIESIRGKEKAIKRRDWFVDKKEELEKLELSDSLDIDNSNHIELVLNNGHQEVVRFSSEGLIRDFVNLLIEKVDGRILRLDKIILD